MDTLVLSDYGNEALNTSSQQLWVVKDIANDNGFEFRVLNPLQALLTAPSPN
jgi:hypothetical protein